MSIDSTDLAARARDIEGLLETQLRRIRRRFAAHGTGWMIAAALGCGLAYFALDRLLQLPVAVRVVLTLGTLAYLVIGLRRRVLYPMQRPLARDDVALAIEQRFPELQQKLISAHQLERAAEQGLLRQQSEAMVQRVLEDATVDVHRLPVSDVIDPRRTVRVWAIAAVAILVTVGITASQPLHVWTMLQRAVGLEAVYPRLTSLYIELPSADDDYRIEEREGQTILTLAAGADLPVLVRAERAVPREVYLMITGGRGMPPEIATTRRPGNRFRHVFRQVQSDFSFHARGGDDPSGDRNVQVHTVRPPLVGTLEADLTFPAYTGRPPENRPGGTIEALVGTRVRLNVTATQAVEEAVLSFLDSGEQIILDPSTLEDDSGERRRFVAEFTISTSDRYEVRLKSPDGLRNPRPGTYPIVAVEDHAPVGRILLPSGDDIHVVVPGAILPIRVEAKDDFGLATIVAETRTGRDEVPSERSLLPEGVEGPVKSTVLTELVDLDDLTPGRDDPPRAGETISLQIELIDNREPEAGRTALSRRQVHVVAEADLLRRVSSHFRRLRETVESALNLQRDRREALEALLEDLPATSANDSRLVAIEVGQGRVLSACKRIREGLMQAYDTHLFNRLEGEDSDQMGRVLELYLEIHRADDRAEAWLPEFYRGVAERQSAGRIGALAKTLDPILTMTLSADAIVERFGQQAVEALEAAGIAATEDAVTERLRAALAAQGAIEQELEGLLARLDEWNEFQDVIQQARVLRDAQRDVESRTRNLRGGGR